MIGSLGTAAIAAGAFLAGVGATLSGLAALRKRNGGPK